MGHAINANAGADAVLAAEAARAAALAGNNAQALAGCLGDALVFVHSSATVDDKASLLAKVAEGRIFYHQVSLQPERVLQLADGVWGLWGRMEARILVGDVPREVASSYATVWTRQDDGVLRLVMHHGTPVAVA